MYRASAFALGLATTLAALGVASSLLGRTYGQYSSGLPIAVSAVAMLMGLNLLEVVQLRLPSLNLDTRDFKAPPSVQVPAGPHALHSWVDVVLKHMGAALIQNAVEH